MQRAGIGLGDDYGFPQLQHSLESAISIPSFRAGRRRMATTAAQTGLRCDTCPGALGVLAFPFACVCGFERDSSVWRGVISFFLMSHRKHHGLFSEIIQPAASPNLPKASGQWLTQFDPNSVSLRLGWWIASSLESDGLPSCSVSTTIYLCDKEKVAYLPQTFGMITVGFPWSDKEYQMDWWKWET